MYRILLLCVLSLFPLFSLSAKESSPTLSDTEICLYYTSLQEKRFGIKENLLSTIALVETGRYNPDHSLGVNPWPWTVTSIKGSAYHKSKKEAISKIKSLISEGVKSIDVGCMQINLKFHGEAFSSIEDALDPEKNTAYAASYLKRLYRSTGSWGKAATTYHSGNQDKALKYEEKLISAWRKLNNYKQAEKVAKKEANPVISDKKTSPVKIAKIEPTSYTDKEKEAKLFALKWREQKMEEYIKKKQIANGIITSDL